MLAKKISTKKVDLDISKKLAELSFKTGKRNHGELQSEESGYDSLDEMIKRQKSKFQVNELF